MTIIFALLGTVFGGALCAAALFASIGYYFRNKREWVELERKNCRTLVGKDVGDQLVTFSIKIADCEDASKFCKLLGERMRASGSLSDWEISRVFDEIRPLKVVKK